MTSLGKPLGRAAVLLVALAALLLLAACAGPNPLLDTPRADGDAAGFWLGLWHGIVAPFTLIISFFTDNISLYEVHNTGGWYDFGFALGAGILFGGIWRGKK